MITGSGCTLGTTLSAYLAANRLTDKAETAGNEGAGDRLHAALAGKQIELPTHRLTVR